MGRKMKINRLKLVQKKIAQFIMKKALVRFRHKNKVNEKDFRHFLRKLKQRAKHKNISWLLTKQRARTVMYKTPPKVSINGDRIHYFGVFGLLFPLKLGRKLDLMSLEIPAQKPLTIVFLWEYYYPRFIFFLLCCYYDDDDDGDWKMFLIRATDLRLRRLVQFEKV